MINKHSSTVFPNSFIHSYIYYIIYNILYIILCNNILYFPTRLTLTFWSIATDKIVNVYYFFVSSVILTPSNFKNFKNASIWHMQHTYSIQHIRTFEHYRLYLHSTLYTHTFGEILLKV